MTLPIYIAIGFSGLKVPEQVPRSIHRLDLALVVVVKLNLLWCHVMLILIHTIIVLLHSGYGQCDGWFDGGSGCSREGV